MFAVPRSRRPAKVLPGGADFIGIQPAAPSRRESHAHPRLLGEISRKNFERLVSNKEGDQWYAFTQFEPLDDARRVFDSMFDEPRVQSAVEAATQGENATRSPSPTRGGLGEHRRQITRLVQFERPTAAQLSGGARGRALRRGRCRTAGKNHTPVRDHRAARKERGARFAKETSPQVLNELEAYFGIPYPYEKLDCLDVPSCRGAMENRGSSPSLSGSSSRRPIARRRRFGHAYVERGGRTNSRTNGSVIW